MDAAAFDQFLALNAHLTALAAAGVPINLGRGAGDTATELERINAEVALEVSRGTSLETALAGSKGLPAAYRSAMLAALRSGNPLAALDALHQTATARKHLQRSTQRLLTGPAIVFVVAFVAFLYLCQYLLPRLEGVYAQLGLLPSAAVTLLGAAREWLPYWGPLALFLLLAGMVLVRFRGAMPPVGWIPQGRRYLEAAKYAAFADQLARLVEHNISLTDALRVVAGQTDDGQLAGAAAEIADSSRRAEADAGQHTEVQRLPALLRWSLTSPPGVEDLPANLRFAANFYRRAAQRRIARIQFAIPVVGSAMLGGAIVFAYGLAVFAPVVQLLVDLSR